MTAAVLERPLAGVRDEAGGCEARKGCCGKPAVAVATWDPHCGCFANPQKLCVAHRDEAARGIRERSGWFLCGWCEAPVRLVRLEPLP